MQRTMALSRSRIVTNGTSSADTSRLTARLAFIWTGVLSSMIGAWQRRQARIETRCHLVCIACLPPHRIRDLGHDPETVFYALKGSVDEILPIRENNERA